MNFINLDECLRKVFYKQEKKSNIDIFQNNNFDINNYFIDFQKRFYFSQIVLDNSFQYLPFYLALSLPKSRNKLFSNFCEVNNSTNNYVKFYLKFYNLDNTFCGKIEIIPNANILIPKELIVIETKKLFKFESGYVTISILLKKECKFNFCELYFSFVDYLSTHVFHDDMLGIDYRFKVNNLKKKNNGIIIFFPSFYIKERDTDRINNHDNSVKWPNFTRHSWSKDLDDYCTIFISDPYQFVNGNDKSSWFISKSGYTVLSAISEKVKEILEITNSSNQYNYNVKNNCGPIIAYGSSMGGYAAFVFSCFLTPTFCFCECPQSNLRKYRFSNEYIKQNCLEPICDDYFSFSKILKKHKPSFRTLVHFYSLDKFHIDCFNNEISLLNNEERKSFNYQLVVENDIENQLFAHQAMPKEKVLEIFKNYLSKKK